ncbi:non-ribosomal peptide synthetase [Pseudomonas poae]|uniref:Non-ribosomal peptide synthetase n=1 Tax=Pseudomonas poae TaxID=200451 RepID=A0A2S9EGD7_9PSED|nr:amino acid adenylation domain-containing protein [Pseudomonas poae]PRA33149.1 non-ribosomal peptide synthetase [Pseudomonas poae]PRC14192.1 non-ribosomal peptide synthetase [Pseudomonas poae]
MSTSFDQALSPEQQAALSRASGDRHGASLLLIEVRGELELARLQRAANQVLAHQPILATRLVRLPAYRGVRQVLEHRVDWPLVIEPDAPQGLADFEQQMRDLQRQGFAEDAPALATLHVCRLGEHHYGLALRISTLLSDRNGLQVFYRALHQAYAEDQVTEVDEEAAQYAQYVEWRGEMAQDEDAANGRDYWRQQGTDIAPSLAYRRSIATGAGARQTLEAAIDPALQAALGGYAESIGQPLRRVLQAAWWALLARISGQPRMQVGWQHDCRLDYEFFADCVGVFEKTLPLLIDVPLHRSLGQWLPALDEQAQGHLTWQEHWPVEAPPSVAHLACGVAHEAALEAQGGWSVVALEDSGAPFELELRVIGGDAHVQALHLRFDAARYDAAAVEGLLDQYQTLLHSVVTTPDAPLADLCLVGAREQALHQHCIGAPLSLEGPNLALRIAAWAQRTPEALAVSFSGVRLTHRQLDERVERLARHLRLQGVQPGDVVALVLPRSLELVVALLAVWRAGAAWVPVDPQWPAARQALIIEQAAAVHVLGDGDHDDARVIRVDAVPAIDSAITFEWTPAALDQPAYVLFTSGSTGTPKGVVVEHRQLLNYVQASATALGLAECTAFAMTSTVAADLGHTTLLGALFQGAPLHIATDEHMQDAARFADFLRTHGIDCLKMVPSHLAALLDQDSTYLPGTLVLGGEAVAPSLVELIFQVAPACRLFNHYGPTEATVGVLYQPLSRLSDLSAGVPLGHVFDGCAVYLFDERLNEVPLGALGELFIGGQQVARGYLHDAGHEAFIEHPRHAGERLYRTGDLGRYLPQGGVQLMGRRDHQVKVRGFRIELTEIEQALLALPGVAQAVVMPWRAAASQDGELQLVAYLQAQGNPAAGWLDGVREQLAARLPAAMLPTHCFVLEQLPRLANGKLDRQGLPAPESLLTAQVYVAPSSALQTLLAEGMAQLLGVERLSVEQNFFALGGHSLLVIKLVSALRKQLQLDVHPGVVFDHPSVAELAVALTRDEATPGSLERTAQVRLKLNSLSPEQREALLAKSRASATA